MRDKAISYICRRINIETICDNEIVQCIRHPVPAFEYLKLNLLLDSKTFFDVRHPTNQAYK